MNLLKEAGWSVEDGKLTNEAGESMDFEVLLVSPLFERITAPFAKNLERLGIKVSMRTIDPAQYQNRLEKFDFDMVVGSWGQSLSPGNEQRDFWGTEAASREGSRNWLGVENPAIDALIDEVIQADSREALVTATRALDRVLLWNHYVIPQWHSTGGPLRLLEQVQAAREGSEVRHRSVRLVDRPGQGGRGDRRAGGKR